jgi:dTDP-4-dehydrorhamnose reductase
MSTKILVLGSRGMLGHMVFNVLSTEQSFEVKGTNRVDSRHPFYLDVDVGFGRLAMICKATGGYDYFINCVGITRDRIDENDSASVVRSVQINSIFPHKLAEFARNESTRVLHISTDAVFSGSAEGYYEDALHDCIDVYGKTKSLGEVISDNFLNIRCSIIGPSPFARRGLLEWFLSQPEGSVVSGYTSQIWNGVSTLQFANLCREIISQDCFDELRTESHVFHFVPNQPISKYDLLNLFKSVFQRRISILPAESESEVVKRILMTRYNSLKELVGYDLSMQNVVEELSEFV